MPEQKIQDKQKAILEAAVAIFSERGFWNTPTSLISKTAGIADGTLFNYFETKDDLINEVYLYLKQAVAVIVLGGLSTHKTNKDKIRHIWNRYIEWGVNHPNEFKVLYQISDSYQLSDKVKAQTDALFLEIASIGAESILIGEMRDYPVEFLAAFLNNHAVMTIQYITANKATQIDYQAIAFEMFWNGITY
ncbi:MAG: TetR/AcrR family transcriptional regulator [Armatimonadetes bacterium]|nr:TetR/AcrR family transcriptional regulator [Anaerolineae bacterium]